MSRIHFNVITDIPAPPQLVWAVVTDVERWPGWTASVSRVVRFGSGPLRVGSRARIHQPRLPLAWWRVTESTPGAGFTWVSVAPGMRVTARHVIEAVPAGSRVTLSIHYEGLFGKLLARWTHGLNERYLAMEANGLNARCTELATKPNS